MLGRRPPSPPISGRCPSPCPVGPEPAEVFPHIGEVAHDPPRAARAPSRFAQAGPRRVAPVGEPSGFGSIPRLASVGMKAVCEGSPHDRFHIRPALGARRGGGHGRGCRGGCPVRGDRVDGEARRGGRPGPRAQAWPPSRRGHTRLVPDRPRTNTPRIGTGEIWDMEVVGTGDAARVFIAGTFTSAANTISPTTTVNQPHLLAYNLETGLIDTQFRPTFGGGGVAAVEATPDGSKLFVAGSFNTVGGVARQKVASLDLTTGAPISRFAFTHSTNNRATALAATNSTLYVGGRFSRINGQLRSGLAAVERPRCGRLGLRQPALGWHRRQRPARSAPAQAHPRREQAARRAHRPADRRPDHYGMGVIDTATKELLPWRSWLWDDNLAPGRRRHRIDAADIAPDDSYFVVTSGSGGDKPPINDTAIAYPPHRRVTHRVGRPAALDLAAVRQHLLGRRHRGGVYVGGHFQFVESPSSDDPRPGLDDVGYGFGQGLSGYGLGDHVVRRDHIAAIDPANGKALEWNPWAGPTPSRATRPWRPLSRSARRRRRHVQGRGAHRTGRVLRLRHGPVPGARPDTSIATPIEGRVVANNVPVRHHGIGAGRLRDRRPGAGPDQDRDSGEFLQDDGTAFTTFGSVANTLDATLAGSGTTRTWSVPATITTNRNLLVSLRRSPPPVAEGGTPPGRPRGSSRSAPTTRHHDDRQRAGRHPVLHHLHHHRHRERRQGRELAELLVPGLAEPLPAGRRFGGRHLQLVPRATGRHRGDVDHLVVRRHPAARGGLGGRATAIDTAGQADLRSASETGWSRRRWWRRASRSRSR